MNAADQVQDLVDAIAEAAGAPVTLEDRDLLLVASSGHDDVIDDVRRSSILRRRSDPLVQRLFAGFGIARATGPLRIPGDPAVGRLPRWCLPVRWRGVTYGYLWLLDPHDRVRVEDLERLHDALDLVAAHLATRARAADRTTWAVGELLSTEAGSRARAAEELQRDGLLPATVSVVALAPVDGGPAGVVNGWLLPRSVLVAAVGHRAALVVPAPLGAREVAERAAAALSSQHPAGLAVGVSGPVAAGDAHTGWQQADAALRSGGAGMREWERLGALRLNAVADPVTLGAAVRDERARRLLAAEPELALTARTYLDLAGSAQRTAAALSIHRQTLYHRLRRVEAVSGYVLDDGRDRLALHLALVLGG
ncbi:PucR family transcriptional regulator [Kineococcus radiotolerans]|uniref:Transcriptional regulator, PucR family n=1 Tax=Kineococcus radiotolerans (strain ATCC BAA-149 / DSM 14245 / SRS30216) TaxID=266940 RepID=A6WGK4_KINRD|nr:helix-turn-helix domain-containing protein [Kineococcus radiotolerans]ABS05943.1 putative transcriptional regulator, PucR family [Kineococcus radiotolerans SRS30216 = ATCC BAA-149]